MSMAAIAAMVGCAKEAPIANLETKEAISIVASIDLSETRVTVEGEKFTDVKWEQGDNVTLSSAAGASATLTATAAGNENVRFEGEGTFAADTDTYYAIYPATAIEAGVATFDLTTQSGSDVAILAAKAENVAKGSIPMTFQPINSLLHVAVSGVETLAKAEFMAYDGASIASGFSYDFANDTTTSTGSTATLEVSNPATAGFFFSLPADLDMANGYVVRLTDGSGNVCSKAYNGKTFARGTTTRVDIAWSTPSVTLGKPMTSYSYYVDGQASTANGCANNVIYFPNASSYANVQNAMVAEVGVIVDGTPYTATIDTTTKSFTVSNVTVTSWGAKSVEAYIKTKDGETYKSAAQTVYITGLPYVATPSEALGWTGASWNVKWSDGSVQLGGVAGTGEASVSSSQFSGIPATINTTFKVDTYIAAYYYDGIFVKTWRTTTFKLFSDDNLIISQDSGEQGGKDFYLSGNGTMTNNSQIKLQSTYELAGPYVLVRNIQILYR